MGDSRWGGHIQRTHMLFSDQPEALSLFAPCIPFHRDYYRDEADPPAAFALLLSAPDAHFDKERARWIDAGADVATVVG
jgi:hypothetical protein